MQHWAFSMGGTCHYVNGCVAQGTAELRGMEQGGEAHALTRIQACPAGAILAVLEALTLVILCFPDVVPKHKSSLSVYVLWLHRQVFASLSPVAHSDQTQLRAQHSGKRASCQGRGVSLAFPVIPLFPSLFWQLI